MQNIRDLRKRIRSVESIRRITSAMEKIAAARLFRARMSLASSRPYTAALEKIARDLLNSQPEAVFPLAVKHEEGYVLVILVTSDRGLCGGYNTRVIERAAVFTAAIGRERVKFIVLGRKGVDFLRKHDYDIVKSYVGLPPSSSYGLTEEISRLAIELYLGKEVSEVHLIATEFVSIARHTPKVTMILPVALSPEPERNYMNYSYEPDPGVIVASILPRLVRTRVWSAVMESMVSEHAARMFMMERATKNTDDMIASLVMVMNKARQSAITRELTDIVGAAETMA